MNKRQNTCICGAPVTSGHTYCINCRGILNKIDKRRKEDKDVKNTK